MAISNQEMFEEFYRMCNEESIEEVVKSYGGSRIYIPSYKSMYRDQELIADHRAGMSLLELQRKYYLSDSHIKRIIAAHRDTPSLFEADKTDKTHQE